MYCSPHVHSTLQLNATLAIMPMQFASQRHKLHGITLQRYGTSNQQVNAINYKMAANVLLIVVKQNSHSTLE